MNTETETHVKYQIAGARLGVPYSFYLDADKFAEFTEVAESGELDGEIFGNGKLSVYGISADGTNELLWSI